jgi:hypothetical protein
VEETNSIGCVECNGETTSQTNAYDKLDSFFDHFGGEDDDILDESEGFKTPKQTNNLETPEWADAEFKGEFTFKQGFKDGKGNTVEENNSKSIDCVGESTMVTVGIHQEALLVKDEVINREEEWTYWLVDLGSTTHIDLTMEGMVDVVKMEKGEDQV